MIDTIAMYIGYVILGSVALAIIGFCWFYGISAILNSRIEVKAIAYAIASNRKDIKKAGQSEKIDWREGREWWVHYKKKSALWRCVKVEERE